MSSIVHALLAALLLVLSTPARQDPAPDRKAAAERAFTERDYAEAAKCYAELAGPIEKAGDVVVCYRLGYCLHSLGRLEEALPWHERAAGLGAQDKRLAANAAYNVACAHAMLGRKDRAISALQRAVECGFADAAYLWRDTDLDSIRGEPVFAKILKDLEGQRRLVAIVVHDEVELLDFAGPAEVFSAARGANGEALFRVVLVAPKKAPLRAQHVGGSIVPEYGIGDCPQPAVLVIPGGNTNVLEDDADFLAWVKKTAPKCDVVLSVCTGAFVLAKVGLLDGKEATTFHGAIDGLQRAYPAVRTVRGKKFVDSGACVTAAGVSSGIDGALHVVARLCGNEVATNVAKYIEFAWQPETPAGAASSK